MCVWDGEQFPHYLPVSFSSCVSLVHSCLSPSKVTRGSQINLPSGHAVSTGALEAELDLHEAGCGQVEKYFLQYD